MCRGRGAASSPGESGGWIGSGSVGDGGLVLRRVESAGGEWAEHSQRLPRSSGCPRRRCARGDAVWRHRRAAPGWWRSRWRCRAAMSRTAWSSEWATVAGSWEVPGGFDGEELRRLVNVLEGLCVRHGITLVHSPVRRPRYNGTCEVSGRWANLCATAAARARGAEAMTSVDLAAAVTVAASKHRSCGARRLPTRRRRAARNRRHRVGTCSRRAAAPSSAPRTGTRGRPASFPTLPHPDHRTP